MSFHNPPDTNRSVFRNWCARIDLAIAPFILIMTAITLTVFCSLMDRPIVDKGCEEMLCVS